jgi:tetratricopeptide (TPR) repeat protein
MYYGNLMTAQVSLGRLDSADATLRILQTRAPNDPHTGLIQASFIAARGDYDSARAIVRRMQAARPESPNLQTSTNTTLASLALAEGRLAQADEYLQAAQQSSEAEGLPERALVFALARAGIDLWYRGQPERARQRIDAALQQTPLSRFDPADRPYLPLALLYAEAGRPERARGFLAEHDRLVPEGLRRLQSVERHAAAGSIALAERRRQEAIDEFRQQDQGDCVICALGSLGRAYDDAGQADSAVAVYERYVGTPYAFRVYPDAIWLARTYYRLGELYEARGNRAKAAENYAKFVRLWKNADPELRPKVLDAKSRLKALTGEEPST